MSEEDYKIAGGEEIPPMMVSVIAPSTLPAGYTFEAYLNDDKNRPFTCEVVSCHIMVSLCSVLRVSRRYMCVIVESIHYENCCYCVPHLTSGALSFWFRFVLQ